VNGALIERRPRCASRKGSPIGCCRRPLAGYAKLEKAAIKWWFARENLTTKVETLVVAGVSDSVECKTAQVYPESRAEGVVTWTRPGGLKIRMCRPCGLVSCLYYCDVVAQNGNAGQLRTQEKQLSLSRPQPRLTQCLKNPQLCRTMNNAWQSQRPGEVPFIETITEEMSPDARRRKPPTAGVELESRSSHEIKTRKDKKVDHARISEFARSSPPHTLESQRMWSP
jgi:hypothetical protein